MAWDRIFPLVVVALYVATGVLKLKQGDWQMAMVWISYATAGAMLAFK